MKTIDIELTREDGETYFSFEIDEKLEEIFRKKSEDVRVSECWLDKDGNGYKFYLIPQQTKSSDYKELLNQFDLFDDYGTSFIKGEGLSARFNIAFLRTVGGSGKIRLRENIPYAIVTEAIKDITSFLRSYYENYLQDYSVKGSVQVEV